MELLGFSVRGEAGAHVHFQLIEVFGYPHHTAHTGGYDARGMLSVNAGGYTARGELWTSTGEIHQFMVRLHDAYQLLRGSAVWRTFEGNFSLELIFGERGNVEARGYFQEYLSNMNRLEFEFLLDQSFIGPTLDELKCFEQEYGGARGVERIP